MKYVWLVVLGDWKLGAPFISQGHTNRRGLRMELNGQRACLAWEKPWVLVSV